MSIWPKVWESLHFLFPVAACFPGLYHDLLNCSVFKCKCGKDLILFVYMLDILVCGIGPTYDFFLVYFTFLYVYSCGKGTIF